MKTKIYILTGLLSLASAVVAQASSLVDTWTVAGGAFTAANQTGYVAGTGGQLQSDGTIASSDTASGAYLNVANIALGGGAGLGTTYLYTGASTPTFNLVSGTVLPDVATITVSFTAGGLSTFNSSVLALTFDSSLITPASFSSVDTGTMLVSSELYAYTYSWDVSSLAIGSDAFTVEWTDNGQHTAFNAVTLTQASAVPEPSTYAAIFGGIALVGAVASRRFKAKSAAV